MLIKLVILIFAVVFVPLAFLMATKNGYYNTDRYHGNGSAH